MAAGHFGIPDFTHRTARRIGRRLEAEEQVKLMALLDRLLDPACVFATAVENKPRNALAGALQVRAGVRRGLPDLFFLHNGRLICIELKSYCGEVSKAQLATREALLAGGLRWWWLARSARAVVHALHLSNVPLRTPNGRRWRPPVLPDWERPTQDPALFKPSHPRALAEARDARARQRERARWRALLRARAEAGALTEAETEAALALGVILPETTGELAAARERRRLARERRLTTEAVRKRDL
jgi:hypothetical protein